MKLDKNSFNIFDAGELADIFRHAQQYYMSIDLDRRLDSQQQVARCYVEAVLALGIKQGKIALTSSAVSSGETATDHSEG